MHPIETALLDAFNFQLHQQSLKKETSSSHLFIAYSGGLDSSVLLFAAAQLLQSQKIQNLTALHVNHGLQNEANDWELFCENECVNYHIPFSSIELNLLAQNKTSENDARKGRYDFFASAMQNDDVIALAHHQNDQVETLLFRLFRGTGLQGLSGIPQFRNLEQGVLIRPLLDFPRQDLENYAKQNKLNWVEDPSNQTNHYSRNFIRNEVVPLIKQKWSSVEKSLINFSGIAKEQIEILNEVAQQDLNDLENNSTQLQVSKLLDLSHARQKNCLHFWVKQLSDSSATSNEITEILNQLNQLGGSVETKSIKVKAGTGWVRSYDGNLFYCLNEEPEAIKEKIVWDNIEEDLVLDNGLVLSSSNVSTDAPIQDNQSLLLRRPNENEVVTVRARVGGEVIKPSCRQHSAELKKIYQELKVPNWQRKWLPLIYYNEQLVAIPSVAIDKSVYVEQSDIVNEVILFNYRPSRF